MKDASMFFREGVINSWWLILFFFVTYFAYDQASADRNREQSHLFQKKQTLLEKRKIAQQVNEDLKLQLASCNEPEYLEMTLIRVLRLVPEGQTKIRLVPKSK